MPHDRQIPRHALLVELGSLAGCDPSTARRWYASGRTAIYTARRLLRAARKLGLPTPANANGGPATGSPSHCHEALNAPLTAARVLPVLRARGLLPPSDGNAAAATAAKPTAGGTLDAASQ